MTPDVTSYMGNPEIRDDFWIRGPITGQGNLDRTSSTIPGANGRREGIASFSQIRNTTDQWPQCRVLSE